MARFTDYNEQMNTRAQQYIISCEDTEVTRAGEVRIKVKLPTVEGLAIYLGVSRDTLYEWAKHHDTFSDTLDYLKAAQADKLINSGLSGDYNSTIVKLMLSSNHGMREKSDVTTNDKDLPTPILSTPHVLPHNSDDESLEAQ